MEAKLVSVKEASKIFKFPLNKLYKLIDENEVPHIKMENLSELLKLTDKEKIDIFLN
ncbi:MAG TPA: hypothetical protein VK071_02990 [Tissierellales bacterium]|nr:hypothetical protein [Tissierellales bacterium]